jgi:hypothetical protein
MAPGNFEEIKKLLPEIKDCANYIERLFQDAQEFKEPKKTIAALEKTVGHLHEIMLILNESQLEDSDEIQPEDGDELKQVKKCRRLLSATIVAFERQEDERYLERLENLPGPMRETHHLLSKFVSSNEIDSTERKKDSAQKPTDQMPG